MNTRSLVLIALALPFASCCPTLWLQVTKGDPAPWPEVAPPLAWAPPVPVAIPNRFDVLGCPPGTVTRSEDGYRDATMDGDDRAAQQTHALDAMGRILASYHDQPLATCATSTKAKVSCTRSDVQGLDANCNALIVDEKPTSDGIVLIRGQDPSSAPEQYRVTGQPSFAEGKGWFIPLTERIDARRNQEVDVCFPAGPVLSRPLLSFIHLSDIQLRDPSVVLTDRTLSKRLDWFQPLSSFEYDEDMAFYNQYLVEAMMATINASAQAYDPTEPERPLFVIHTGDSVDSNMTSELRRFHTLIDRLQIPFYELFGNHDLLVFGNLTPTDTHTSDGTCSPVSALIGGETWFAPDKLCVDKRVKRCPTCLGDDVELLASTRGHAETRRNFMELLWHAPSDPVAEPATTETGDYCPGTHPKVGKGGYSRAHGFDLGTRDDRLSGERLGYYAFARALPGDRSRQAVFIALDSEDLPDGQGGITGHVGHQQLDWLRNVLACVRPHDLVFVFGHQPLSMIGVDAEDRGKGVLEALEASPNVVAYLYGHNHRHSICGDHRDGRSPCSKFWEIETGSLIEFPQEGRLVRLKQLGQKLAFLELSTFTEQLRQDGSPLSEYVSLARRGAERDFCVTATDARCSADHRPYRNDGDATAARLFFNLP